MPAVRQLLEGDSPVPAIQYRDMYISPCLSQNTATTGSILVESTTNWSESSNWT